MLAVFGLSILLLPVVIIYCHTAKRSVPTEEKIVLKDERVLSLNAPFSREDFDVPNSNSSNAQLSRNSKKKIQKKTNSGKQIAKITEKASPTLRTPSSSKRKKLEFKSSMETAVDEQSEHGEKTANSDSSLKSYTGTNCS
ncbi:hypothetical protein L596_023615 [Steinernema carpocapsae]|uniref:Nematode cuticle collagen N-terminal domain-containing protein n=1 Tax=Steinernema carpocapsae TaxID=34508 RepID=A0A4U5ME65_STECR|nr:hypothetical protein L596_023615 [Steinernema carpocapsae]